MEVHEDPENQGWVIASAMPDPVFREHPLPSWKPTLALALLGAHDLSSWTTNGAQVVDSDCQGRHGDVLS